MAAVSDGSDGGPISRSQQNAGYGADFGPSQENLCRFSIRPKGNFRVANWDVIGRAQLPSNVHRPLVLAEADDNDIIQCPAIGPRSFSGGGTIDGSEFLALAFQSTIVGRAPITVAWRTWIDLSFSDSDCPQLATSSMPRLIACDRRSARAKIDQTHSSKPRQPRVRINA